MGAAGKITSVIVMIHGIVLGLISGVLAVMPVQQPRYRCGIQIGIVTTYSYQGIGAAVTLIGTPMFIISFILIVVMIATGRRRRSGGLRGRGLRTVPVVEEDHASPDCDAGY
jgi:uncharacterized membrane protein YtjA (UPF0391 family)